jgi:hypothetical protein
MRTGAGDHTKLVDALDHASHSLAAARESLGVVDSTTVAHPRSGPTQARARAEIGHVARLLEEAREPGRIAPETIDGAAHALDRELSLLAGGVDVSAAKVIQTRIEERDGGTWVTGLCPYCWERVAVRTARDGTATAARCSNGHRLAVVDHRSAGAS